MAAPAYPKAAIGRYPHTAALLDGAVASDLLRLEDAGIAPISRAFAPMVREGRFDVVGDGDRHLPAGPRLGKAAGAAAGRARRALPGSRAALPRRWPDPRPRRPRGRRIGVRAYSQTTGMWLRGTLADRFASRLEAMRWTTFEDAHVPEYRDPPWAERAPPGSDMLAMLRDGTLDAAIFGNDTPAGGDLRTVFPDPTAAGRGLPRRAWLRPGEPPAGGAAVPGRGDPDLAAELVRLFRAAAPDRPATDRATLDPALTLAVRYCVEQGLLPRPLAAERSGPGCQPPWRDAPTGRTGTMTHATRRALLAGAAGLLAAPAALRAQEAGYPSRPVTVVVPWAAGGSTDAFARVLAGRLSTDLGQGFVVDNRTGANGTIGLTSAARARPDGHTADRAAEQHLCRRAAPLPPGLRGGEGLRGRRPAGLDADVHAGGEGPPAKTLAEYVALAKQPGAKQTYANSGIGATSHLATEMLLQAAGIEVADVGYRGGGPAIQGVLTGECGMLFMPASAVMGFMASGDLRALAVASPGAARWRRMCRPSPSRATRRSR